MSSSVYDTGIRPAIDAYLKKKGEEIRDYGEYWSASSAGYCMRKNIFERLGVPHVEKDSDERTTRVFEAGHIFHEFIQRITKDSGLSIAQELELLDEDLKIKGHFDDLVLIGRAVCPKDGLEYPNCTKTVVYHNTKGKPTEPHYLHEHEGACTPEFAQKLILYDYKTAHSRWFEYAKGRPMSHYNRMQLATYMYLIKNATDPDLVPLLEDVPNLDESRILKISKDDLRLHEIVLNWTPDLEKEIVGYWRTLNGYWEKKTIPKCTCADYEKNSKTGVGFMADPKYNPYYYNGEPCSIDLYNEWKESNHAND